MEQVNHMISEAFDINNENFKKMMDVINSYHDNDKNLYNHHIIPKCYFKKNNIECDNSKNNLVALTYEQHLLVHYYGYLSSKEIIRTEMFHALSLMLNTIDRFEDEEFTLNKIKELVKKENILYNRKNDFLNKAKNIFGEEYNYDNVDYINTNTKVEIICKKHGSFYKTPHLHIYRKQGCPSCAFEASSKKQSMGLEMFLKKAKDIHKDNYDYSFVEFKNVDTKVEIVCNVCGNHFWQTPDHHIYRGDGCPICRYTKGFKTKEDSTNE